jgi:DnaK suppressor protein
VDESVVERTLVADRDQTLARIASMTADFDSVVAAAADSNLDDEHDPEGSTIAFERAQLAALLAQARSHLLDIDRALERVKSGDYAVCQRCGGTIPAERLAARPAARVCINCATS